MQKKLEKIFMDALNAKDSNTLAKYANNFFNLAEESGFSRKYATDLWEDLCSKYLCWGDRWEGVKYCF